MINANNSKRHLHTALQLAFFIWIILTIVLCLPACNIGDANNQAEYPFYEPVENTELEIIELHYNGIVYRPFGIFTDSSYRGEQIGARLNNPDCKICEIIGYNSDEWIVEYLDVFMGGNGMILKSTTVTNIPDELAKYKEYDF